MNDLFGGGAAMTIFSKKLVVFSGKTLTCLNLILLRYKTTLFVLEHVDKKFK